MSQRNPNNLKLYKCNPRFLHPPLGIPPLPPFSPDLSPAKLIATPFPSSLTP